MGARRQQCIYHRAPQSAGATGYHHVTITKIHPPLLFPQPQSSGAPYSPGSEQLTVDELDRLVERGEARTGETHLGVLVPDRHAAEKDQPVRE